MSLVIDFPDVSYAIEVALELSPGIDEDAVAWMRNEYDDCGGFIFDAFSGDKSVLITVVKVGNRARATVSGYQQVVDLIKAFCQEVGVGCVEE